MPQGWRPTHPGDPTPKWGIGKAGCLAIALTVIAGIVIGIVILATRTADAADDGSSQRLEVREASYAVTFPEDWAVEIVEEGSDTAILVLSGPERFGPDVELQNLLVAWAPGGRRSAGDRWYGCTLVRYEPIELTADEFLNEIFGQSDLTVESLHVGLSRVLVNQFMTGGVLADEPDAVYGDVYAIGGDNTVAVLWCTGVLSRRDEWLSIAESFEFLAAQQQPSA